ncbi:hypothetical protein GIB67_020671 [Kingdonia uniflora]|uniref:Formamidopyrimidine-DNA glycosylase-like C-terminal domain-containing protein n=1 Tax=Kingdonia uniflora TaxID=39325 RepID=A0A7J7NJK0_9MAGN|nr:hypothetical protein GIB67_020671 [Kingdonia uniflora]
MILKNQNKLKQCSPTNFNFPPIDFGIYNLTGLGLKEGNAECMHFGKCMPKGMLVLKVGAPNLSLVPLQPALARIHPLQIASSLSKENCASLHKSIKEVVNYAVEVDADCSCFPNEWLFHFRWGKKSGKVNGETIEFITAGGRTTAYVPELQKLPASQVGKISGKPRKQLSEVEAGNGGERPDKSKPNKGQKKATSGAKRLPTKRTAKVSGSDDDNGDDDDNDDEKPEKGKPKKDQKKTITGVKRPPIKRKVKASGSDDDDNDDDEESPNKNLRPEKCCNRSQATPY